MCGHVWIPRLWGSRDFCSFATPAKKSFFLQRGADLPFRFPMAIGDVTANMLLGSSSATAPPKNRLVEMLVVRHGSRGAPPDRPRGLI